MVQKAAVALLIFGATVRHAIGTRDEEQNSITVGSGEGDHICCCEFEPTSSRNTEKCFWTEPYYFDTGSGCNFVGGLNLWANRRHIVGLADKEKNPDEFFVFDVRNDAEQETYKKHCQGMSGRLVRHKDKFGNTHQYIMDKTSELFKKTVAPSPPPNTDAKKQQTAGEGEDATDVIPNPDKDVTPGNPANLDVNPANLVVTPEYKVAELPADAYEKDSWKMPKKEADEANSALEKDLKPPTNAQFKWAERGKASKKGPMLENTALYCKDWCTKWPSHRNKKGCRTPLQTNKKKRPNWSNAKKYCKKKCEPHQCGD